MSWLRHFELHGPWADTLFLSCCSGRARPEFGPWARAWAKHAGCWGTARQARGSNRHGTLRAVPARWPSISWSGCAAPAEGLTLNCQLARDPSRGCIATTRTTLPGSKWTSVKKYYVISYRGFSLVIVIVIVIVSDWLVMSLLYYIGITITPHSFTYLHTLLVV